MIRFAPLALATLLAATAPAYISAQTTTFTDPANLRGERVAPRTGRELPIDQGTLGLEELLRKLNTRASILNIVAHPDDEDGGMLTLYARGLGARVADLSLTRGEGGQNAVTADFEDALGLLRTQELLSNDRYTGVSQMFGTEVDFGFSKTKAESFTKWGHQRVLYDVVRAIRLYRPLVITSTWIGNPTDGHGQHQVSGEIAQEAFLAAGDPNVFPELTREGILPWQPLKMYARVPTYAISSKGLFDYATGQYVPAQFTNYVTGVTSATPPSTDIVVHEGTTDPLITTCAANPSDLPPTLSSRPEPSTTNLSSRPEPATTLSSRPESSQSEDAAERPASPECRPLSYVQFARIGLGLQRTQIGPGVRNAPSGPFDVAYHLYASRVCTSSIPSPTPQLCHPERSAYRGPQRAFFARWGGKRAVEGPRGSETSHNSPPLFDHDLQTPDALTTQPNFFDGIDTSLEGIATLAPNAPPFLRQDLAILAATLSSASTSFDANHPDSTAPRLAEATVQLNQLLDRIDGASLSPEAKENLRHELLIKRTQLNDALALALGLHFDATAAASDLNTDTPVKLTTRTEEKASADLSIDKIYAATEQGGQTNPVEDTRANRPLAADHPDQRTLTLAAAETLNVTRPYFFRDNIEQPVYQLREPALRNAPATPPALVAWANVDYKGVTVALGRVVHAGNQPVSFVPPLSLTLSARAQVLPLATPSLNLTADVQSTSSVPLKGKLLLSISPGWTVKPSEVPLRSAATSLTVATMPTATPATLAAVARTSDGDHIREGYRPVGYGDLPRTNFYTPATDRIVPVDLQLPPANKRRIGYLEGTGDAVPAALTSIGLAPTMLKVSDLTPEKLSHFDTIILGVRTYNAHPDLHGAPTAALLDFARNGGNVIVQYQTGEFTAADAPFPLELGYRAEKVVDETDPVEILHPSSTLFTTPNHIVTSDFDHWIEERAHGFLTSWDPRYTALTETHDPGQSPQKGGLITVRLGKGRWTYCAFALYRQLPEAVPGAYRLFANLLSP